MMQEEEEPETEPNVNEPTKKFIKELINQINNSNTDHNIFHNIDTVVLMNIYILMNNLFLISIGCQDITLILFFLTNNRCLLTGFLIIGFNSERKISNRSEIMIYIGN